MPVNGLYSALSIVLGALGLAVVGNGMATRLYTRCLATLFTAFSVLGCIPALNTVFGCIPLFGYNVIVHAAAAAVAATIGWAQGETPEATNRPTPWWLVGVAVKVSLVIALWSGVVALSLFHEITWWYNGPVRPTAAVLRGWVKREVPRYASPTQTLSFLRSHFLGPGMGSDQYVSVSANEIAADISYIQDSPGCSLQLHLVFRFDGMERLAAYSLDQQPICM